MLNISRSNVFGKFVLIVYVVVSFLYYWKMDRKYNKDLPKLLFNLPSLILKKLLVRRPGRKFWYFQWFFIGMDRTDFADKENMAPQQQQLQQQQQQQMLLQQQQVIWVVNFSRERYKHSISNSSLFPTSMYLQWHF